MKVLVLSFLMLNLANVSVPPKVDTFESEEKKPIVLSEFSTSFEGGTESRINNITQASVLVDGTIVNPGEIFSFNQTVGPTVKRRGFAKGKIFIEGKEAQGYGGGVCQVSSTIYNAALEAGFEIVERHPHSKKVYYVEDDRDAATSFGGIDMKFKNNFDYPILINSYIYESRIYISIEKV